MANENGSIIVFADFAYYSFGIWVAVGHKIGSKVNYLNIILNAYFNLLPAPGIQLLHLVIMIREHHSKRVELRLYEWYKEYWLCILLVQDLLDMVNLSKVTRSGIK